MVVECFLFLLCQVRTATQQRGGLVCYATLKLGTGVLILGLIKHQRL